MASIEAKAQSGAGSTPPEEEEEKNGEAAPKKGVPTIIIPDKGPKPQLCPSGGIGYHGGDKLLEGED